MRLLARTDWMMKKEKPQRDILINYKKPRMAEDGED